MNAGAVMGELGGRLFPGLRDVSVDEDTTNHDAKNTDSAEPPVVVFTPHHANQLSNAFHCFVNYAGWRFPLAGQ